MSLNIKHKRSSVAGSEPTPAQLQDGELAVNYSSMDPALYVKDSSGTVVRIAGAGAVSDVWKRTGTELEPTNAGDDVFTSGDVKVGGATTLPNTKLNADGSASFKGNVGIGTTDPSSKLAVKGDASNAVIYIESANGASDFDGSGAGLLLTARTMNTNSKFTPAIRFGSTDADFVTQNPKTLAAINGIAEATYNSDTQGAMSLAFYTTINGSSVNNVEERMRILHTGNVGIGTTNPQETLHVRAGDSGDAAPALGGVDGAIIESGASRTGGLVFSTPNDRTAGVFFKDPDSSSAQGSVRYLHANDQMQFTVNGSTASVISSNGNVGIRTTDPQAYLQIGGSSLAGVPTLFLSRAPSVSNTSDIALSVNAAIRGDSSIRHVVNDGGYFSWWIGGTDVKAGTAGATEVMRINSSGNVGINTTNPSYALTVRGTGDNSAVIAVNEAGTNNAFLFTQSTTENLIESESTLPIVLEAKDTPNAQPIIFRRGANESARIDPNGRLLVGTTGSVATSVGEPPLQVTTGQSIIRYASTGSFGSVLDLCHSKSSTAGTNTSLGDGDAIGRISYGGADGSSYVPAARIDAFVDGTPGTNDMPGRLVFSTTANGASSPTERMRIKNDGTINFSNVAVYADNTAAKAGGLVDGDVYRQADGTLMIVFT